MTRSFARRGVALGTALVTTLMTSVAAACPVCASREEAGPLRYAAIGALVLLPWAVAATVGLWIRRGVTQGDGAALTGGHLGPLGGAPLTRNDDAGEDA